MSCSYKLSLRSSGKAFCKILKCARGNVCPLSQKSICKISYRCWMRRLGLQSNSPQGCFKGLRSGFSAGNGFSILKLSNLSLCKLCCNSKWPFSNLTQDWKHTVVQNVLCCSERQEGGGSGL